MSSATIRDVARQARVSIKTVWRVINNVQTVKADTRDKVMRAIRRLDYHPNPSARGLGSSRSYLIDLLYDVSCDSYAIRILAGMLEVCRAAQYQVVMDPCDYRSPALDEEMPRGVRQSRADGVVMTPPLSDFARITTMFDEKNIPFVRIAAAERRDFHRSVYTTDRESCARITERSSACT